MNKTKVNIAIILVNHNGSEDTVACVNSIEQNDALNCFFIVVDNSAKADVGLQKIEEKTNGVILKMDNLGFGAANNLGIQWANNQLEYNYLLLLNNDTEISENAISKMISCLEKDKEIDIITCKTNYFNDQDVVWYGGGEINYKRGWPELVDYQQKAQKNGANLSRFVSFASGCVMLFTKASIEKLNGFDERFFMYVEDLELCVRAKKENLNIWYSSESTIYHKVHGSFQGQNKYQGFHPKNNHVDFHYYHKKINQWIAFKTHLKGADFRKFFFSYWGEFLYTTFRLVIFSPKRFKIMALFFKITGMIIRGSYHKA